MAAKPIRVGLVLGAGGAVGHAYHAGVLAALAERTGFDPREAEVVVGTSAGSIVGALLRAGVDVDSLVEGTIGRSIPAGLRERFEAAQRSSTTSARAMPRNRGLRIGLSSPGILAEVAMRPWRIRPGAVAAALLPAGRIPTSIITDWLQLVIDRWPERPLWVCAVSRSNGRRRVFGRNDTAVVPATAVAASCAVPGLFAPVTVDGVEYVDGGVHSPTNADLVAGLDLDVVVVSSPMSAARPIGAGLDLPGRRLARLTLGAEMAAVRRRRSVPTLVFQPTNADRQVMGLNAMDRSRREPVIRQARKSALERLDRDDARAVVGLLAGH